MPALKSTAITPSAARLTESLRDIGYDFPSAVADIVDNSVMAGATRVEIRIEFEGLDSSVTVADNGCGMTANGLVEALRYGTRRTYSRGDLGRYGLGLKTASLSQCRSVTVVTRSSLTATRIAVRELDLDLIAEWDEWLVVDPGPGPAVAHARDWLAEGPGTVVMWRKLDRVLPENRPDGGWARRRLQAMAAKTAEHLGMVFHRFLEDTGDRELVITVNGEKVQPWNPFAPGEPARVELAPQRFEVAVGDTAGTVGLAAVRAAVPGPFQLASGVREAVGAAELEPAAGPVHLPRRAAGPVGRLERRARHRRAHQTRAGRAGLRHRSGRGVPHQRGQDAGDHPPATAADD